MYVLGEQFAKAEGNINQCYVEGTICTSPILKTTHSKMMICAVTEAVNRGYGKSAYLPCIAWGGTAKKIAKRKIGDAISFEGRVQSRNYNKDGDTKTCIEISINNLLD